MATTFVVFAILVSTHLGEFWPFSIYPMFSSAGNPWTRSLVHELPPDIPENVSWQSAVPIDLPGKILPLATHGIYQNDLANYVSKTEHWTGERIRGVEAMFAPMIAGRRVMVYRVTGTLTSDGVDIIASPLMMITSEGATLSPEILERGGR
jgi:hypothetical protein